MGLHDFACTIYSQKTGPQQSVIIPSLSDIPIDPNDIVNEDFYDIYLEDPNADELFPEDTYQTGSSTAYLEFFVFIELLVVTEEYIEELIKTMVYIVSYYYSLS